MKNQYVKYVDLLRFKSWQSARKSGIEYEELFSEANILFCLACKNYKEKKNVPFKNYLFQYLHWGLQDYIKKEENIKWAEKQYAEQTYYIQNYNFLLFDLFKNPDEKKVLDIIFNPCLKKIIPAKKTESGRITKTTLYQYLKSRNWKHTDIIKTFTSITKKLKEAEYAGNN